MEPLAALLLIALAGGAAVWFSARQRDQRLEAWLDAATPCGLQVMEISGRSGFKARAGPLEVRIEDSGQKAPNVRIGISVPALSGFGSVRIRRPRLWQTLPELLFGLGVGKPGASEIEIGDRIFDGTFFIEGPMRLICMLLDAETRRLFLKVSAQCWVEIAGGELRAETSDDKIADVLPLLLDLGRRFAQSTDVVQCLIDNALRDPEARVRLNNLLLLVRECARSPRTAEALRAACSDADPRIRLRAAIELGVEGHGVLLELAESTEDDDLTAQAMRALGPEVPLGRTTAILEQSLRGRRIHTACACLEALGSSGTAEAVDTLVAVLSQEGGEIAAAAAQALGRTGSAAAEPALILALRREMPIKVAAAEALGRVGSVAAVLPLKEAAQSLRWDADLARATRQAIAEIQLRLPGASPGQLSLAGAEAGQLSLALAEAGQLSLAVKQAGQLSLSDDEDE